MKLEAFKPAPPVSGSGSDVPPTEPPAASQEAPQEELGSTSITPSGIEVYYQPKLDDPPQRRLYRVNGIEVPSVTTVLKPIDDPNPLIWWGMKVGVAGMIELGAKHQLVIHAQDWEFSPDAPETLRIVDLLTQHELTVNHSLARASKRGTNVHTVLESWCETGGVPDWQKWPESERNYVKGLTELLTALGDAVTDVEAEVMLGSVEHQFAGRCDLTFRLARPVELVTRVYPKRKPKIEEIPAGRHRWDLKTSKHVMSKHHLQNEGYEGAAVECGYEATDYRAIAHVTADGRYELVMNSDWCFEDFLAVRKVYQVLNEREILRVLREDLDAKEVA